MSSPVRYYNDAPLELTNVDQEAGILRNVAQLGTAVTDVRITAFAIQVN